MANQASGSVQHTELMLVVTNNFPRQAPIAHMGVGTRTGFGLYLADMCKGGPKKQLQPNEA